jgi:hypothetical protein
MQAIFKDFTPTFVRKASKVLAQHSTNISEPACERVFSLWHREHHKYTHRNAEVMDQAVADAAELFFCDYTGYIVIIKHMHGPDRL